MKPERRIFLTIAVFWLVILGSFIGLKEYTFLTGTEILLDLKPVDPRDLFRGDYVILDYDISDFPIKNSHLYRTGDTVYVRLQEKKGGAIFAEASTERPDQGLFIKGKIKSITNGRVEMTYGIESYFLPEGKGRAVERNLGDMQARIIIDSAGRALVKDLVLEGKVLSF